MDLNDLNLNLGLENDLQQSQTTVHLRIYKRNGRKCTTQIEGLMEVSKSKDLSLEKLLKELKKMLSCNGSVKDGVIQLQGDHRSGIKELLIKKGYCKEEQIKVHGFDK